MELRTFFGGFLLIEHVCKQILHNIVCKKDCLLVKGLVDDQDALLEAVEHSFVLLELENSDVSLDIGQHVGLIDEQEKKQSSQTRYHRNCISRNGGC